MPLKTVKGQAIADFITEYPCVHLEEENNEELVQLIPWILYFDGSNTVTTSCIGVLTVSPHGHRTKLMFKLDFDCSNNQAEYEALIVALNILANMKVRFVKKKKGDFQLVINQLSGDYQCLNENIIRYFDMAKALLDKFFDYKPKHIKRNENTEANELAQMAFGYKISKELARFITTQIKTLLSIENRIMMI